MDFKNKIPNDIIAIFDIFKSYQQDSIRLVGGCVRDLLTNKMVNDYDFASIFTPTELTKIANENNIKIIPTGIDFGTVTIIYNTKAYEVTTLREDFNYDGRKPTVIYSKDYFEDSKRRDFTINALYINQNLELIDYHNGIEDLKSNKLKYIGNPKQRIKEDNLRILRYFRFLCLYNKKIDSQSLEDSCKNIHLIKNLSRERICNEIIKVFNYKAKYITKSLRIIKDNNIDSKIFIQNIDLLAINNIALLEEGDININSYLKLYSIFTEDNGILFIEKLGFPKSYKKYFITLKNINIIFNEEDINYYIVKYSKEIVTDLMLLRAVKEQNLNRDSLIKKLVLIKNIKPPQFPITGEDLLAINILPGPKLGEIINKLKVKWCQSDFTETKKSLLNFAKNQKNC